MTDDGKVGHDADGDVTAAQVIRAVQLVADGYRDGRESGLTPTEAHRCVMQALVMSGQCRADVARRLADAARDAYEEQVTGHRWSDTHEELLP